MTQQTRWTNGYNVEMGHFLSVKNTRSKFHDIPLLDTSIFALFQKEFLVVTFTEVSCL